MREALSLAFDCHAGQKRKSGEPFITHPVEVALILAQLRMDAVSVIAGLLHDTVEDCDQVTFDEIEVRCRIYTRRGRAWRRSSVLALLACLHGSWFGASVGQLCDLSAEVRTAKCGVGSPSATNLHACGTDTASAGVYHRVPRYLGTRQRPARRGLGALCQ